MCATVVLARYNPSDLVVLPEVGAASAEKRLSTATTATIDGVLTVGRHLSIAISTAD